MFKVFRSHMIPLCEKLTKNEVIENESEYDMTRHKSFVDSVKDNGITRAFSQILSGKQFAKRSLSALSLLL